MQLNQQTLNNLERNLEITAEQLRGLREREGYLQAQLAGVKPHIGKGRRARQPQAHRGAQGPAGGPDPALLGGAPGCQEDPGGDRCSSRNGWTTIDSPRSGKGPPDNPAYVTLAAQLASTRVGHPAQQRQHREAERRGSASTGAGSQPPPRWRRSTTPSPSARNSTQAKVSDLMRKLMEARVAHGLEKEQKGERFTLIDPPRLPEKPFKPNRLAIMLIGLVLGIGAGVGVAALREFSDDSVHDGRAAGAGNQFPVLAGIPVIETARDLRQKRLRRMAYALGTVGVLAAGILVFHFFVMDLDVFWARLVRRMPI